MGNFEVKPNKKNFCGGNFQDWLEVNLLEKCNGKCSWCVEKHGFHPKEHVDWIEIVEGILKAKKKNVILLGGEPTLHKKLYRIVGYLASEGINVYLTTNGSHLSDKFIFNFIGMKGINISIHDYDLDKNEHITGIKIENLKRSIWMLHGFNIKVRLNCNCIKGHIDSKKQIKKYIEWAKMVGADSVRFAELKFDEENFVDLAKILNHKYGLNDDPFKHGCNNDVVIDRMNVNFRQMCGLQTSARPLPINPEQCKKKVLYYDGKIYDGWQLTKKEKNMKPSEITELLLAVKQGKVTVEAATRKIKAGELKTANKAISSNGCVY